MKGNTKTESEMTMEHVSDNADRHPRTTPELGKEVTPVDTQEEVKTEAFKSHKGRNGGHLKSTA